MSQFIRLAAALLLVATSASAAEPEPEWRYTIRPGDTLIGFSRQYLAQPAAWPRLQKLNRIADPLRLQPGANLRVPVSLLRQTAAPAELVTVSGEVELTLPGAAARKAMAGDRLPAGARLVTRANSSASLRFADGSQLVVQPASRLELDTVSVYAGGGMVDTRLRLQEGRAEIQANPQHRRGNRLQVITPSAVAAVRGTRFRVAADGSISREETLAGEVGMSAAAQEVVVAKGMGTVAEAGLPPRPPVALLPAPDGSHLPVRIERLPMRFDLPDLAGAVRWIGQIAPDAAFERVLVEKSSESPRLVFADLPDGRYVLRVRAGDALGLQGRDALHAFELDARPFPPLPVAPANAAVMRTALPELTWTESAGVSAYRVELAQDAEFAKPILQQTATNLRVKPAKELAPGEYFWRVASVADGERGPFTDTVKFIYKPLPGAPDLAQSALRFEGDVMHVTLPEPSADLRYEAELAADMSRKQVLWHGESDHGILLLTRPEAGKAYFSVRLVEADGTAGPFATQVIEVPRRYRWEWLLLLLPLLAL